MVGPDKESGKDVSFNHIHKGEYLQTSAVSEPCLFVIGPRGGGKLWCLQHR